MNPNIAGVAGQGSGPAVATGTGNLTGMELVCTQCGSLLCCWTALGLSPKHLSASIGLAGRPTRLNHAITFWLATQRSDGRLRYDMFVERDVAGLVLGRTCGQLPRCYLPVHVAHPIRCRQSGRIACTPTGTVPDHAVVARAWCSMQTATADGQLLVADKLFEPGMDMHTPCAPARTGPAHHSAPRRLAASLAAAATQCVC